MRREVKVDPVSLASGVVIAALGALLLVDSGGRTRPLPRVDGGRAYRRGRRDLHAQRAPGRQRAGRIPSETETAMTRDTRNGWVAGVLAGLGDRVGVDPLVLRIAFVIAAIATGGLLLLAYLVAWAALPAAEGGSAPVARFSRVARVRGDWRVAVGVGLLTLSALLAFRELGIWWSDALVWPLVLAAFGAALLWVRSPRRAALPADGQAAPRRTAAAQPGGTAAPRGVEAGGGVQRRLRRAAGGRRRAAVPLVQPHPRRRSRRRAHRGRRGRRARPDPGAVPLAARAGTSRPSGPSGSARRSAPSSPPTSTTRCSRRSP